MVEIPNWATLGKTEKLLNFYVKSCTKPKIDIFQMSHRDRTRSRSRSASKDRSREKRKASPVDESVLAKDLYLTPENKKKRPARRPTVYKETIIDGHKKYLCQVPECKEAAFTKKTSYKRHWNLRHHPYAQKFLCPKYKCRVECATSWDMSSHLMSVHGSDEKEAKAIWFDTRQIDNPKYIDATEFERPSPIKKRKQRNQPLSAHNDEHTHKARSSSSHEVDAEPRSLSADSPDAEKSRKKIKKGKKVKNPHTGDSEESQLHKLERETVVYDDLDEVEEPPLTPSPTLRSHIIKVTAPNVPDTSVKVVLDENNNDRPLDPEIEQAVREEMIQIEREENEFENEIELQAARSEVEGDFPEVESELDCLEEVERPPETPGSSKPFPKLIPLSPSVRPHQPIRDLEAKVRRAREYKAKWQQSEDKWLMELRGMEVGTWRGRYQEAVAGLEKERALR